MEGGSTSGFKDVKMRPFLATAKRVMARRGIELTPDDCDMLEAIYKLAKKYK